MNRSIRKASVGRASQPVRVSRQGVTLIEMLVVIGIIVLLAALLTPAAMGAISRARVFAMSAEINKLQQSIEAYKLANGDYPPSFGDTALVQRHMRKCYPKIDAAQLTNFITRLNAGTIDIDQSEALVFWLAGTLNNPILPLPGAIAGQQRPPAIDAATITQDTNATFRTYMEFDARRLEDPDGDGFFSLRPQYAKQTFYVYVDSRMYLHHMNYPVPAAMAPAKLAVRMEAVGGSIQVARPFFSDTADTSLPFGHKFMNPTTFQILCAGQDGEWHLPLLTPNNAGMTTKGIIRWPSGTEADGTPVYGNPTYTGSEFNFDNLANFSGGMTFKAAMPAP